MAHEMDIQRLMFLGKSNERIYQAMKELEDLDTFIDNDGELKSAIILINKVWAEHKEILDMHASTFELKTEKQ